MKPLRRALRPFRVGIVTLVPFLVLGLVVGQGLAGAGASATELTALPASPLKADRIIVDKAARRLELRRGKEVLRSYRIALGWQPSGDKLREGDGRTPEGFYRIDWRNPDSSFYRSLHVSYPSEEDRAEAADAGVEPGGMIMIHGLPNGYSADLVGHPARDWTNGCIAVADHEMDEIWRLVDDGTQIIIRP